MKQQTTYKTMCNKRAAGFCAMLFLLFVVLICSNSFAKNKNGNANIFVADNAIISGAENIYIVENGTVKNILVDTKTVALKTPLKKGKLNDSPPTSKHLAHMPDEIRTIVNSNENENSLFNDLLLNNLTKLNFSNNCSFYKKAIFCRDVERCRNAAICISAKCGFLTAFSPNSPPLA